MNAYSSKTISWGELNTNLVETFDSVRNEFKNLFTTVKIIQNERDELRKENSELKGRIIDLEKENDILKTNKTSSKIKKAR